MCGEAGSARARERNEVDLFKVRFEGKEIQCDVLCEPSLP